MAGSAHTVAQLRAQLERVQGRRLDAPVLPVHPALASLLPGGGLRPGAAYSLPRSTSVLLALLAQPSQSGSWCGVIGMPRLGAEAAEGLGVDLSRLVLIPDPGARWLAVTSTVAEVLPVVAVRPSGRAADGEIARLAARLRDRGAVLLVQGPWPQAEAVIEVGRAGMGGRRPRARLSLRPRGDAHLVEPPLAAIPARSRDASGCRGPCLRRAGADAPRRIAASRRRVGLLVARRLARSPDQGGGVT